MAQTIQNNIKFNNIYKDGGVKCGDTLIQSTWNPNAEYPSDYNFPLINAVDIDWNGAEADENTTINTTGELLAWIKSNMLSLEDRQYLELLKQMINIVRINDNNLYWYAGTTLPNTSNISTIGTSVTSKPSWPTSNPQSMSVTNTTGASSFIYYCFPAQWNVTIYDEDKKSEMTYSGNTYVILRQGRKTPEGGIKDFWAVC